MFDVRIVLSDVCVNIKERLQLIKTAIERHDETSSHRGIQYTVIKLEAGLTEGILIVPRETYTTGELIQRTVYELTPDISNISYIISSHEKQMNLTIRHTEDVTQILLRAIKHILTVFDSLQRDIMNPAI